MKYHDTGKGQLIEQAGFLVSRSRKLNPAHYERKLVNINPTIKNKNKIETGF